MADLDLDALEALIAYADPSAPIDHMAVYVALRDAAPALFAAAKAQTLTLNTLRNTGEEVARRGSTIAALRALLDKAEEALKDIGYPDGAMLNAPSMQMAARIAYDEIRKAKGT